MDWEEAAVTELVVEVDEREIFRDPEPEEKRGSNDRHALGEFVRYHGGWSIRPLQQAHHRLDALIRVRVAGRAPGDRDLVQPARPAGHRRGSLAAAAAIARAG